MGLVKIDVIGLQTAQARLDRIEDMPPREPAVIRSRAHRHPALGRENDLMATPLQPFADNSLGAPGGFQRTTHRIAVCGIEEIYAEFARSIHDREAARLIALLAEGHRTQANLRHLQ